MKKQLLTFVLLFWTATMTAQTLHRGRQFMDLLQPMEGSVAATSADWGTAGGTHTEGNWSGTLGRWKDNGIEDAERSYWGANIVRDDQGKFHMYVAGWLESTANGHAAWSSASRVYHVTSDNVWGPYTYVSDLGSGHNPELYKTGDTYVIYKIEPLGYYKSSTLGDNWERGEYTFDLRDRILIAGENRETSLSNCSFAKREDGSFVMIDRGGGIWVSRDGLSDPWHQLTDASVYLNSEITNRGSLEDPVIWHDHLQYHMVVNDWRARHAYYYRSLDGLHWVKEAGKAYTGQDPFAKHSDGTVEAWYKYERPRVYQDELGRAIRMNFAVIDCVKSVDKGSDSHSSKNINMPLIRPLLLEVLNEEPITAATTAIRVRVKAEEGFNPQTGLNLSSLRFGSHDKVNYAGGFKATAWENSGSDLIVTFSGNSGESGITASEFAPKMLGEDCNGQIAFGYASLPYVDYQPAMLSALTPMFATDGTVQSVHVSNYGQKTSKPVTVCIYNPAGTTLLAHGTASALAAYANETVSLTKDATASSGYKTIQVRFYDGSTLLNTENIPLTAINAAQTALQSVIDEAEKLYADAKLTTGKEALKSAIDAAKAVVAKYSIAAIEEQAAALTAALNTYKYANASPTNGLAITIENATMDNLSAWSLTRRDADNAPGWKLNAKGAQYDGFDGTFMEYWVNQSNALGYANRASQTLADMPAGRYRLRAHVIATRQNSDNAATGITLFANSQSTACATAKDGTPQEFMVEIRLDEAGPLEIGLNVKATTTANWVAWDNVSLKYFGTADGEIVEEEITPHCFDEQKLFHIKWNTSNYNKVYWRSPKYNTPGDANLHRTSRAEEAALFIIRSVAGKEGQFYLYNVVSHQFVVPSANANNGTAWTTSSTTPGKVVISEADGYFTISSPAGGEANAYANDNNDGDVKNYAGGSQWLIEEAGVTNVTIGINPQAVYRLHHLNTARNRYMATTPGSEGFLLTTNTDAAKGGYSLLPVPGQNGYYYIYNNEGYFVTPSTTNWTLSRTTPAPVKVELNIDNMEAIPTNSITFLLGENNQHANAQNKNSTELVYAYSDHPLDKGNNWVLEPVANATASLSLTHVTSSIETLVSAAIAEDIPLSYTATVGTAGYATLVVPFEASVEGTVEAYTLTAINDSHAILGEKVSVIEANKPVLLKNQGTLALTARPGTAAYSSSPSNGLLRGTYAPVPVSAGNYVLQDLASSPGFYLVERGSEPTLQPFCAYLSAPAGYNVPSLPFALSGESTSLLFPTAETAVSTIFSLNGIRQSQLLPGLNIIRLNNGNTIKILSR